MSDKPSCKLLPVFCIGAEGVGWEHHGLSIHLFHHAPWRASMPLLVVLWRAGLNAGFKGKPQLSVTLCGDIAGNSVWEQEILLQHLFSAVIEGHFCTLSSQK